MILILKLRNVQRKMFLGLKYIISIYDYGGLEVFNAIHSFFLTKYGLYVVAFDMRQLVKSADERERERGMFKESSILVKFGFSSFL
jgi:hypothetical protein